MPFKIYGHDPASPRGIVFSRDYWSWAALWTYCEDHHAAVVDSVQFPYDDSAEDGLDESDSRELATRLSADIDSGAAFNYTSMRDLVIASLTLTACEPCEGTGIRSDDIGVELGFQDMRINIDLAERYGRDHGWCDRCFGEGVIGKHDASAQLSVDDIADFVLFLESCGGFSIGPCLDEK